MPANDGKAARVEPVTFTRPAAERIAKVVRKVEAGDRNAKPLTFERIGAFQAPPSSRARIRLGKSVDAISLNQAGYVALYREDPNVCVGSCQPASLSPLGETVCVQNLIEDIPADAWVYVAKPSSSDGWHIIGRGETQEEKEERETDICGLQTLHAVTLTFSACHGTAASAYATVDGTCPGPIEGVVITSGGRDYAIKARAEPVVTILGSGRDAAFTPTFTQVSDICGIPHWQFVSVSVSGGEDYEDDELLTVVGDTGTIIVSCPELRLQAEDGVPQSVSVIDGGELYKENPSGSPYVANVTVNITQLTPSAGSGAAFTAVVEDDTTSTAFGKIVSISIDDQGDDYVHAVNRYPLREQGFWFSQLPAYDGSKMQILGHTDGGCLTWLDVTSCDTVVPYGVCCDGTAIDVTITSQTACDAATMTWVANKYPSDLPGPCCDIEEL